MIQYEYFPPAIPVTGSKANERRTSTLEDAEAHRQIGSRAMSGWRLVSDFVDTPSGETVSVCWFLDWQGGLWALYVSEAF